MPKQKLTNEIVDFRLKNRNIIRLDDYINARTKIRFQCTIDGYIWNAKSDSIFQGNGCPECAGLAKLNNKIIDDRLIKRNILRKGEYINNKTIIPFQCLIDDYIWDASPDYILNGNGRCPKCSGNIPVTNDSLDVKLEGRNIKRLGDVNGLTTKISFQCLIDNHIWDTLPSIILAGHGCLVCSGKKPISNELIDLRLEGRNIRRLDDVINDITKIQFQCTTKTCNHIWFTTPNKITSGAGCPMCKKKNEKRILEYLIEKYEHENIEPQFYIFANDRKYYIDFEINGILIEYHGKQHYEPVRFGGRSEEKTKEAFIKQVKRDYEVREYCREHNIRLIEIPYWLSHKEQYKLLEELFII